MTEQQFSPLYHRHESQQTAEEILAYWTAERIAAAQPLSPPSPLSKGHPADENRSRPADRPASTTLEEPSTLAYKTTKVPSAKLTTYPYQSAGKLLFTFNGKDCAGSAAVVAQNGIITAAHNLYVRKEKKWVENVLFCPAFTNGKENKEYGSWTGRECTVPMEWYEGSDTVAASYDVGLIKLHLRTEIPAQISKAVKPLPLLVDMEPSWDTSWLSLGYPVVPEKGYLFNGQDMWECSGSLNSSWDGIILKDGNLTEGASGGPWLFEQGSSYLLNAVTRGKVTGEDRNAASYFGKWVETFFRQYFG